MHLDPHYIQVLPRLTNTGSNERVFGTLSLAGIDIGFRHFEVARGIDYDINLTNTSEAILVSGTAVAGLATSCDRCLESTRLDISGEVQGYYLFKPIEKPGEEKLEVYELVDAVGRIDIAPPVLAAIVYELPAVTLCKPDCEGLAPPESQSLAALDSVVEDLEACGINPESPFAALKDYPFDE